MDESGLAEVAGELYSLAPSSFTARRDERAREARASGDADLAKAVKKLPRPALAAWAVNMLVRHDADQVTQVLDLGASLREAQASMEGEALRDLGRQRRQLVTAVTRQARSLAADLGHPLGESVATQVEETLHAALIDEDVAAAVRSGLLVKPVTATGVDSVDVAAAMAVPGLIGVTARPAPAPDTSTPPTLHVVPDDTRAVEEAEAAVHEARRALDAAAAKRDKAEERLQRRRARSLQLHSELEDLRRRVDQVEQQLETNDDEVAEAEELRDDREEIRQRAAEALEAAESALQALR